MEELPMSEDKRMMKRLKGCMVNVDRMVRIILRQKYRKVVSHMKDQMPDGCQNCGKYEGEIQSVLRERLVRVNDSWLCRDCAKEE
jgi:hypothetical protein